MRRPLGPIAKRPRWLRGVWGRLEWTAMWQGPKLKMSAVRWMIRVPGGGLRTLTADEQGEDVPQIPTVSNGQVALTGVLKSTMLSRCPELQSWLCDPAYPDGKPIGATQLSIRRRGSAVHAQLKIADLGGLKIEASESSIDKALIALEAFLTASPVPWQQDAFPLDQGGKKKK